MRYYTIQDNSILIADTEQALTRFYDNVQELPADYVEGKYIIGEKEIEIEVVDPETGETHIEIITIQTLVPNPNWEQEQTVAREREFHKEFFNTSLGYIRRSVSMADGSHKDFLSDLLPTIAMAVNVNTPVSVIAYSEPDFTQPVEDWTQYQHIETVTAQFIQECFMQLQNDFLPINEVS